MSSGKTPLRINGRFPTSIGTVYEPSFLQKVTLTNIRINNTSDTNYTIWLYYKFSNTSAPYLLYKLELSAGEWVNDDTQYELPYGAVLCGMATVGSVDYVINGFYELVNQNAQ